jgi:hypothetical protein
MTEKYMRTEIDRFLHKKREAEDARRQAFVDRILLILHWGLFITIYTVLITEILLGG